MRLRFIFRVFRGSVMCAVVGLTCFQSAFAWILTACTFSAACHVFVSSQIAFAEVADAFQHYLLNTGATVCSTPQSYSSDLCLTVNFQWHFVAIQFSCANHFQSSAVKAMQRVCQFFRPSPCVRRVQQAGPVQPACISRASFSQDCQGFGRNTCLPSLLTSLCACGVTCPTPCLLHLIAAIPSPAFLALLEFCS